MDHNLAPRRMHGLPPSYGALLPEIGAILRDRRKGGGFGKQAVVAAEVGIAAESLSRIENGKVVPRLETLEALLDVLNLDWSVVAVTMPKPKLTDPYIETFRRDRMLDAGSALRAARRAAGLSLRDLARQSGVSFSQLSKVERGQSGGARIFASPPKDRRLASQDHPVIFINAVLARLVGFSKF